MYYKTNWWGIMFGYISFFPKVHIVLQNSYISFYGL